MLFPEFTSKNRQVLTETTQGDYHLGLRLYQVLEILPSYFIKISQSEIVNPQRN